MIPTWVDFGDPILANSLRGLVLQRSPSDIHADSEKGRPIRNLGEPESTKGLGV